MKQVTNFQQQANAAFDLGAQMEDMVDEQLRIVKACVPDAVVERLQDSVYIELPPGDITSRLTADFAAAFTLVGDRTPTGVL